MRIAKNACGTCFERESVQMDSSSAFVGSLYVFSAGKVVNSYSVRHMPVPCLLKRSSDVVIIDCIPQIVCDCSTTMTQFSLPQA